MQRGLCAIDRRLRYGAPAHRSRGVPGRSKKARGTAAGQRKLGAAGLRIRPHPDGPRCDLGHSRPDPSPLIDRDVEPLHRAQWLRPDRFRLALLGCLTTTKQE